MNSTPLDIPRISEEIKKKSLDWDIHYVYETESTNLLAEQFIRNNTLHKPTMVFTDVQTAGRGRQGRKWISQPCKNINLSLIVKNDIPIKDILLLTMIASLTVSKTLEKTKNIKTRIKWPNDVMVSGKKISGILIETLSDFFIIGIGINVDTDFSSYPDLAKTSCSLRSLTHKSHSREKLVITLLNTFQYFYEQRHHRKSFLFRQWQRKLLIPKNNRRIRAEGKEYDGRILGTDAEGFLRFRSTSGQEFTFPSIESY